MFRALRDWIEVNGLEVIWSEEHGKETPSEVLDNANVVFVKRGSKRYAAGLLRAKYLFSDQSYSPYFIRKPDQVSVLLLSDHLLLLQKLDKQTRLSELSLAQQSILHSSLMVLPMSSEEAKDENHFIRFAKSVVGAWTTDVQQAAKFVVGPTLEIPKPLKSKRRVLFYPGNMQLNGVTRSFIALVNSIDQQKYDVTVMLDTSQIEFDSRKQAHVTEITETCNIVWCGASQAACWGRVFAALGSSNSLKSIVPDVDRHIEKYFKLESKRIFGSGSFDIIVDYSGYNVKWAKLIANSEIAHKAIYQHSDMFAEANNTHPQRYFGSLDEIFSEYAKFQRIVSVSKQLRNVNLQKLSKYYGDNTKAVYSPNLVDVKKIHELAGKTLSKNDDRSPNWPAHCGAFKFISVGRLSPEKNPLRLIRSFDLLARERRDIRLFILGAGPMTDELMSEVRARRLDDIVKLSGEQENPYAYMAASDCFVLTSDYEGQPVALLEALVLGMRTIATDTEGARSLLENGAGILATLDDAAVMNAMAEVLLCRKFEPFSVQDHMTSALNTFYHDVLGVT